MLGKTEFIATLAEANGITKKQAGEEVNRVLNHMLELAKEGQSFNLTGVLKVTVKDVEAREGRNPSTGETIQLPATRQAKVSAGATLKSIVK